MTEIDVVEAFRRQCTSYRAMWQRPPTNRSCERYRTGESRNEGRTMALCGSDKYTTSHSWIQQKRGPALDYKRPNSKQLHEYWTALTAPRLQMSSRRQIAAVDRRRTYRRNSQPTVHSPSRCCERG